MASRAGERNPSVKQLEKIAEALRIELHDLFLFEHEEPNTAKLRAMIQDLLREAGRAELQLAYKLLKALLR
jgi:transcriptional regulator with XRE-family HTH domain